MSLERAVSHAETLFQQQRVEISAENFRADNLDALENLVEVIVEAYSLMPLFTHEELYERALQSLRDHFSLLKDTLHSIFKMHRITKLIIEPSDGKPPRESYHVRKKTQESIFLQFGALDCITCKEILSDFENALPDWLLRSIQTNFSNYEKDFECFSRRMELLKFRNTSLTPKAKRLLYRASSMEDDSFSISLQSSELPSTIETSSTPEQKFVQRNRSNGFDMKSLRVSQNFQTRFQNSLTRHQSFLLTSKSLSIRLSRNSTVTSEATVRERND